MDLISVASMEGTALSISVRTHRIVSDLGPSEGGKDLGPLPTELLVGALGACHTGSSGAKMGVWPMLRRRTYGWMVSFG